MPARLPAAASQRRKGRTRWRKIVATFGKGVAVILPSLMIGID
jgi:hypothetical protein